MGKDPEQKAIDFANAHATALYKSAKKKRMPRASAVGWSMVKSIALRVFQEGGIAADVKSAVLEAASQPVPTHEGEKIPIRSVWATHNGRVIKKGG